MIIKKGQKLEILNKKHGRFMAIAEEDFNSLANSFPIKIAPGNGPVIGKARNWEEGDSIPCGSFFSETIKIID